MIADSALKHMCVVRCQQHMHNYLMIKLSGSTLFLVSSKISRSHFGVDSDLTHIHTTWANPSGRGDDNELRASLVIGAYNRWSHQSERQNDTRLPLYHLPWPLCTLLFLFLITVSSVTYKFLSLRSFLQIHFTNSQFIKIFKKKWEKTTQVKEWRIPCF